MLTKISKCSFLAKIGNQNFNVFCAEMQVNAKKVTGIWLELDFNSFWYMDFCNTSLKSAIEKTLKEAYEEDILQIDANVAKLELSNVSFPEALVTELKYWQ